MDGGPGGLPPGGGYPPGFPGYGPPLPGMPEAMFHAHQQAAYWHAFSPLLGSATGIPACSYGASGSSALPMPFASAAAFQYGAPSAGLHSDKQMDATFQSQGQSSTAYDSAVSSASLVSCHAPRESLEANAGAPSTGTYASFPENSFPEKAAPERASVAEPLSTTSSASSSSFAASVPASSSSRHTTPATPSPLSLSSLSSTENPAVGKTSAAASGRTSSGGAGQSSHSPNSRPVDSNATVPEKLTCASSSPCSPSSAHAAAASRLASLPHTPEPASRLDLPDTGASSGRASSLSCAASSKSHDGTPAAKTHAEKAKGPGGLRRVRVPQLRFRKKAANDAFFLKTFSKVSGKRGEPLVWCKRRGRPWWPGLLANPDDPHLVPPLPERVRAKQPPSGKDGEIRLLFLCCGTWRYWWASSKGVRDFREGYADLAPRVRRLGFLPRLAVQHALEECGWRDNVDWCPSKTIAAAVQAEEVEEEDGEGWLTENACSSDSEEEDDGFMDNDWWEGRKIPTAAGNPSQPEEASKASGERAASARRSAKVEETHPDACERQATPQTEGRQEEAGKASPSSLTSTSLQGIASEAPPGPPAAEAAWAGEGQRPEGRRGEKKKDSGREFFPGEETLFERDRKKVRETESGQNSDKNVSGPVRDPEACRSIRLGAARGLVLVPASPPATEAAGPETSSSPLTTSAFVKGSQTVSSRNVETSSVRSAASRFDESHVGSNARLQSARRSARASHPPFVTEEEECESKKVCPMCVDSPEREMFLRQTAEVPELSKAGSASASVLDASGSSAEPSAPSLPSSGDLANSEVSSVTPCHSGLPRPSSSPFSMSFSGRCKGTSQSRTGPAVEPQKLPDCPAAAGAVGDSPAPTSAGAAPGAVSGPLGRAEGGASDETAAKKNTSGVSLGASAEAVKLSADTCSASVTPAAHAPHSWPETIWHRLRRQAEAAKKERPQSPALPRPSAASALVGQARPAESAQETPAIPTYGAVIAFGQEKPAGLKETLHPPHIRAAAAAGAAAAAMAAAAAASAAAEKTQRQEALSLQASQALSETAVGAKTAARLETGVASETGVGSGPENRSAEEVAKAAAAAAVAAAAQVTAGVLGHNKKGDEKRKVPGGGRRGRESETLSKGGRSPRESEDSEAGKRCRASRRRGSSSSWDEDSRAEDSCRRGRGSSRSVSVSSPFLLSQRHRSRPRRDCALGSRSALRQSRGRRRGSSGSSSAHSVSRASSSLSSAPSRLKWRSRRERPRRRPSRSGSTSSRGDRRRHRERHVGSLEKRGYQQRWSSRGSSCRSTDGVGRGEDGRKKEGRRGNRRRENRRREDREDGGSSRCSASSGCSATFRDGSSGSWSRVDRGRRWHSPWRERGDRRDDRGHRSARFSRSSSSSSAGVKLAGGRREADSPDSRLHEEGRLASGRRWARRGRTRREEASRERRGDGREGTKSSLERSPDRLSPSSRRALGRRDERKETVAMGPSPNSETPTTPPPTQSLSLPGPSVCSASAPSHGEGSSSFLPASGSCSSNEASVYVAAVLPERDAKIFQATSAPSSGAPISSSFSPCVSAAAVPSLSAAPQSGPDVWPEGALEAAARMETGEGERRPLSTLSESGPPSSPAPISALPRPPCHLFVSTSTASPSQSLSAAPNSSARDASAARDGEPPGFSVSEGGEARSKHRFSRGFPSSKSGSASPLSRSSRSPSYLSSSSPSRERRTRARSHVSKHPRRRLRSRCSRRSRSPSGSLCERSRDRESMDSQTPERRSRGREARERRGTFPRRGYRRGSSSEFSVSSRRSPSRSRRESESSYLSFAARRVRMLHAQGRCLPCRFHWRRGCRNGDGCKFCHDSSHDRFMLGREPERGSSRSASMGGSRENGGPEGGLSISLENRGEAGEGTWGFLGEDGVRGRGPRRFRRSSFAFSRPFPSRGDGAFREETEPCRAWREKRPRASGNTVEREGDGSAEADVKRGSCVERDERWMEGDACSLDSNPEEGNRVERAPKRAKETDEGSGHQTEEPRQASPATGEKAVVLTVTEGGEKNEGGEEGGRARVDDQQTPGGILGPGDNVDIFHVPCPLEETTFGGSWNSADAPAGLEAEVGGLQEASESGTDGQKVHT